MSTKKKAITRHRKDTQLVASAKLIESTDKALKHSKTDYDRKKLATDRAEQKMYDCQIAATKAKDAHNDLLKKIR